MSQYGARGYAEAGWGYERILAHYYRGTELRVVPARPVRVLLLEGKACGQDRVVEAVPRRRRARQGAPAEAAGAEPRRRRRSPKLRLPLRYEPGASPLTLDGNAYRGALIVHRRAGKLTVVNKLPLDRYLRGVVPWEMPDDWHPEALRAQAVVARSYALATLKPGTLFDLYADTRSQVYGGVAGRVGHDQSRDRLDRRPRALLERPRRDDLLPLDLGRQDRARSPRSGRGRPPVPYLVSVAGSARQPLEASPLGAVPADAGAGREAARARAGPRPGRRARAVRPRHRGEAEAAQRQRGRCSRRTSAVRSTCARPGSRSACSSSKPASGRGLAKAGRPTVLRGFVRGLGKVRLERQVNGGTWTDGQAGPGAPERALHRLGHACSGRPATAWRRPSPPARPSR